MNNNKIIKSTGKCVYLEIPIHACTLNIMIGPPHFMIVLRKLSIYLLFFLLLIAIHYLC